VGDNDRTSHKSLSGEKDPKSDWKLREPGCEQAARRLARTNERKDEVFSHARPEPSGAYDPEISISNRM
jgi:hypothetical protein